MKVTYELLKFGCIRSGDFLRELNAERPVEVTQVEFNTYETKFVVSVRDVSPDATWTRTVYFSDPGKQPGYYSTPVFTPTVEVAPESENIVNLRIVSLVEEKAKSAQKAFEDLRALLGGIL